MGLLAQTLVTVGQRLAPSYCLPFKVLCSYHPLLSSSLSAEIDPLALLSKAQTHQKSWDESQPLKAIV